MANESQFAGSPQEIAKNKASYQSLTAAPVGAVPPVVSDPWIRSGISEIGKVRTESPKIPWAANPISLLNEGSVPGQATGMPNLDARVPTYQKVENTNFVSGATSPDEMAKSEAFHDLTPYDRNRVENGLPNVGNVQSVPGYDESYYAKKPAKTPKTGEITTDFNTSAGREAEIGKHLADFYAGWATDLETLRKMSGYATADQGKKDLIDAFYASKQPKDTSAYLNAMLSGASVPDSAKTDPNYAKARTAYAAVNQFKTSNGQQIDSAVKAGVLKEGTPEFDALARFNPAGFEAYKQVKSNRLASESVNQYANGLHSSMSSVSGYDKRKSVEAQSREPTPVEDALAKLSESLTKDATPDYVDAWRRKISENPDALRLSKDVAEKTGRLQQLNKEEVNLEDAIKARYAGTGVDKSYVDAKIREGLKSIYSEKQDVSIALQTAQSQLSYLTENAKTELDLAQKTYQDREAKAKEARAFEQSVALADYKNRLDNQGIKTQIIKDEATGKQILVNAQTGETIKEFDTGAKPAAPANMQQIKETDAMGNEKVVGYFDPSTGKSTYYGAGTAPAQTATGTSVSGYGAGNTIATPELIAKYPNVAAFKNNNPAGITWNANFDKGTGIAKALADAGVKFEIGTARPKAEGGNYVSFPTIEDGLRAQQIIMQSTYGNSTVDRMLQSWKGVGNTAEYAASIARNAGIPLNSKVSDLTDEQLSALQIAKLNRESPGLLGELRNLGVVTGNSLNIKAPSEVPEFAQQFLGGIQRGEFTESGEAGKPQAKAYTPTQSSVLEKFLKDPTDKQARYEMARQGLTQADADAYAVPSEAGKVNQDALPTYAAYVEEQKMPSDSQLKAMKTTPEQFMANANKAYAEFLNKKAQDMNEMHPTVKIQYVPEQYARISSTQREALNKSVQQISDFDNRLTQLIDLFKKRGTEVGWGEDYGKMQSLRNSLVLKAKEIENLGVLNGPDMGILESQLPATNEIFSFNSNTLAKFNQLQQNYRDDAMSRASNYGAKIEFKSKTDTNRYK